jgi:hypothetical protein
MFERALLGSSMLCVVGCFAEPTTNVDEQCADGKPGCDCGVDGACDAELECVISIDKCVPLDCSPGALTCTCTDGGGCDDMLVCNGGVCLEPQAGTSGHDSGIAEASSAGSEASSTTASSTETLSTTDLPTTTLTTDTLDSSITDVTDATLSTDTGASEGGPFDCQACLSAATSGGCATEYSVCIASETVGGCQELQQCVFDGLSSIPDCCETYADPTGHLQWNAFAVCADGMECMGMCTSTCPV